MIKKRVIFTLLFEKDSFFLSRNFRLQKIGNFDWLKKNYDFSVIANSVDEIILLNVSRNEPEIDNFCKIIKTFTKECFIPISAGGKISSIEIAKKYIQSGADKLVVNSNLFNRDLLNKIANTFGEQCIIASLDYSNIDKYSPKIKLLLKNIKKSEGIILVYSRYKASGVIPISIALEHIGFNKFGGKNILKKGSRESKRGSYVIISGDNYLSPNNPFRYS